MQLYDLLQAYSFDEVMATVAQMYPGTAKYRPQLRQAYDLLLGMTPVPTKKSIRFKIIDGPGDLKYLGAEDKDFDTTWEACLGKNLVREKGVALNDAEMLANCLVNICFTARHPRVFEQAYQILKKGD